LRDEHQFLNLLICELPKGDWAQSVLRQFFFSAFQFYLYQQLQQSSEGQLSAIAEKSVKETTYHLRWSSEWVIRLGDGTDESRQRMQQALADQWMFTGEMFSAAPYEKLDPATIKEHWMVRVEYVLNESALEVPKQAWAQTGGKEGKHTEYMGYLLAEMQHLQRAYPNATW
jgi:ring-1,2-phenylacetyl-CoA epoxidase subunit PaaC